VLLHESHEESWIEDIIRYDTFGAKDTGCDGGQKTGNPVERTVGVLNVVGGQKAIRSMIT